MPWFPLFINIEKRPCLVIGGGNVALRKIRTLLDFGAHVSVIAAGPSEAVLGLAREGSIVLHVRPYAGPRDITGMELVAAASDNAEINSQAAQHARLAGIPINVADDPAECSFFFPAIVRRGDLVAGISTSGVCPRFAVRLKQELERLWPQNLKEALESLGRERRRIREEAALAKKAAGESPKDIPAETIPILDSLIDRIIRGEEP
jgi:siroheme synthase-like protein